ncbi:MAG: ThiF family adenylyltransferase, partial [Firmicutes bacterium]|nr:ThiF family adenylyltransferase [Bacillota bacterium]
MSEDIFARSRLLWGDEGQDKLAAAHVTICGVGGVGAYAAEAIARCGVGEITLIDFDDVSPTNINRQLPALHSTVGRDKLDVMAEPIREINPACTLHLKKEFI